MSLPPIPDEAYEQFYRCLECEKNGASGFHAPDTREQFEAAYPFIAEAVLRWAADRMAEVHDRGVVLSLLSLADEIKEAQQ